MNLVRIRVKLDELAEGDILEARVDNRFYKDVERGIRENGYEILEANKQNGAYYVRIKNTLGGIA